MPIAVTPGSTDTGRTWDFAFAGCRHRIANNNGSEVVERFWLPSGGGHPVIRDSRLAHGKSVRSVAHAWIKELTGEEPETDHVSASAALVDIRMMVRNLINGTSPHGKAHEGQCLAESVDALDKALSAGGILPADWDRAS